MTVVRHRLWGNRQWPRMPANGDVLGFERALVRVLALAHQLNRVVSPLSLPPRVASERRYIYAGVADRLVHPRRQVLRLWEHWDRPAAHWYAGGHLGFFRSPPVGRFIADALATSGMTQPQR